MTNLEAISRIVGLAPSGQAVHGKQQLMLLRLNAVFLRGSFAEIEEPPDLPAELGRIAMRIAGPAAAPKHEHIRKTDLQRVSPGRAASELGRNVAVCADGAIPA